jgi:hypothetical protein
MKKVEVFFEEAEIKEIAEILKKLDKQGLKISRSQYIRSATVEKIIKG